jgi:pilus assembly protein Flp/PilA
MTKILDYLNDESGASAAEYALILALVAIVIIAGATLLGSNINYILSTAATSL